MDFRLGAVVDPPSGFERFAGSLCIPNLSAAEDQHVVGVKFRRLDDGKPKYDQPSGQVARLFNLRAVRDAQRSGLLFCTEGELDCITVSQLGYPCIGVPGADSFAPKGVRYRFRIFDGLRLILIRDNDESGEKLARLLVQEVPDVQVIVPPVKDVNEYFCSAGEREVSEWLSSQTS